jgi:tight adherence protein C
VYITLRYSVCILVACIVFGACASIAGLPLPPPPRLGQRGANRQMLLRNSRAFALLEPLIRFTSKMVPRLVSDRFGTRCELQLRRAQYWLGLTANEFIAMSLLSAVLTAVVGDVVSQCLERGHFLVLPGLLLGGCLPYLQTQEIVRKRSKEITRELPRTIEIAALCMGAGLDFPGTLRFLAQRHAGGSDALCQEFSTILQELGLGHTRREALLNFAERVSSRAVHDFVNAVIQAEQRGNPLAKVIQVQGRMLSMQRSVSAEESAARAGVLMILPMMLLLGCILLLLMGPFIVKGVGF